jgi:hypothetical protein
MNEDQKIIEEAISLLRKNGYFVTKITEAMESKMNECAKKYEENESEVDDCLGCICSICILNN